MCRLKSNNYTVCLHPTVLTLCSITVTPQVRKARDIIFHRRVGFVIGWEQFPMDKCCALCREVVWNKYVKRKKEQSKTVLFCKMCATGAPEEFEKNMAVHCFAISAIWQHQRACVPKYKLTGLINWGKVWVALPLSWLALMDLPIWTEKRCSFLSLRSAQRSQLEVSLAAKNT